MAVVQSSYRENIRPAVNGMPANTDRLRVKSFEVVANAMIPFGRACRRGGTTDADRLKIALGIATGTFVGISMLDRTLQASQDDQYIAGDIAGVLQEGELWVTAEAAVRAGNAVTARADDGRLSALPNRGAWAQGTDYVVGDVVSQGANWYRANRAHTAASGDVADGAPNQGNATAWDLAVNQIAIAGATWESNAAAGELARVRLGGALPSA